jgi:hypothetical protein
MKCQNEANFCLKTIQNCMLVLCGYIVFDLSLGKGFLLILMGLVIG